MIIEAPKLPRPSSNDMNVRSFIIVPQVPEAFFFFLGGFFPPKSALCQAVSIVLPSTLPNIPSVHLHSPEESSTDFLNQSLYVIVLKFFFDFYVFYSFAKTETFYFHLFPACL